MTPAREPAGVGVGKSLTEPQRRALAYIVANPDTSPAFVGHAMMDGREARARRSAQGYGRIGGLMIARLIRAQLVYCSGGGWPRYTATAPARSRLATSSDAPAPEFPHG